MTINYRVMKSFVAAVEAKSLSAAAARLHMAQPALSQHIAQLEEHFAQRLLIRSNLGVSPTTAGLALYDHAQRALHQLEVTEREVRRAGDCLQGSVALGLATYSSLSLLTTPLLMSLRKQHPGINLYLNDNFGLTFSSLVKNGRLDLAIIYGEGAMKGVTLKPLLVEDLFFISAPKQGAAPACAPIALADLAEVELLLPSPRHYLRKLIDAAFNEVGIQPRVIGEIESVTAMREAISTGVGATILPRALALNFAGTVKPNLQRLINPEIRATLSLCVSDHLPVTEPAIAVQRILEQLVVEQFGEPTTPADLDANEQWQCAHLLARTAIEEAKMAV